MIISMNVLFTYDYRHPRYNICIELLQAVFILIVLDNLSTSSIETFRRLESLAFKQVDITVGDI